MKRTIDAGRIVDQLRSAKLIKGYATSVATYDGRSGYLCRDADGNVFIVGTTYLHDDGIMETYILLFRLAGHYHEAHVILQGTKHLYRFPVNWDDLEWSYGSLKIKLSPNAGEIIKI